MTFWKLICSHVVTPRWLDDAKECIQSAWSKQRDYCSIGLLVVKEAFLENYLAILAEQKRYLSVWLRASNERYFSFTWRLIIKHEKLFAAKLCSETNARFINYSQLLPIRPLITHWNWKLICSSVHVLCSKKWCFFAQQVNRAERRNVLNSVLGSVEFELGLLYFAKRNETKWIIMYWNEHNLNPGLNKE